MIRKSMATLLGLKIQACEGEEHPNFIMADGRRRRPEESRGSWGSIRSSTAPSATC
jgi:hypothetical protein